MGVFVLTATWVKILKIENLIRWGMTMLNCCHMCKRRREKADHLLLHFPIAIELWDFACVVFGAKWVMPKIVWVASMLALKI